MTFAAPGGAHRQLGPMARSVSGRDDSVMAAPWGTRTSYQLPAASVRSKVCQPTVPSSMEFIMRPIAAIACVIILVRLDAVLSRTEDGLRPLPAEREHGLKPKDVFKECDKCPEMLVAPPGSFEMGASVDERAQLSPLNNEVPQHIVAIFKPFAVDRFAVTFNEWDACLAEDGCNGYNPSDSGWGRGRRPAINVSWADAQAYVKWLSTKTGKTYRLLSEAEREYVTRAGTTTAYWWGASVSTNQANYCAGPVFSCLAGIILGNRKTVPVETFEPNAWGLYQVHGNVDEWVEDCYHHGYVGAPSDGSAWVSGDCETRVLRGGSWTSPPWVIRAASRDRLDPAHLAVSQQCTHGGASSRVTGPPA
jgi:formylglycine-generating enzyme required for sulfatase activity